MKKNDLFCIDWLLQLWMLRGEGRGKLLLVISYRLSVISYQLSVISYRVSGWNGV